jgi:hypothetical protein
MNSCKQKTGKQILCYKRRTGRIMLVSNWRRDEGEGRCVKFRERSESVTLGLELPDVESACDADGGSTADAVANLPFTTRVVLPSRWWANCRLTPCWSPACRPRGATREGVSTAVDWVSRGSPLITISYLSNDLDEVHELDEDVENDGEAEGRSSRVYNRQLRHSNAVRLLAEDCFSRRYEQAS